MWWAPQVDLHTDAVTTEDPVDPLLHGGAACSDCFPCTKNTHDAAHTSCSKCLRERERERGTQMMLDKVERKDEKQRMRKKSEYGKSPYRL